MTKHDGGADAGGLIASLLGGYERVRPLSVEERASLPLFIALAELRSLLFLSRFCVSDELWEEVMQRALGPLSLTYTLRHFTARPCELRQKYHRFLTLIG